MTPEQVSALSNAELERAMIWLYPPKGMLYEFSTGYKLETDYQIPLVNINYLTDYNLTMPLVVENRLWLQPAQATPQGWFSHDDNEQSSRMCRNQLRAACECLVLIAMSKANG